MNAYQHTTTAKQLFQASRLGRCELVGGELIIMRSAGFRYGRIACAVAAILPGFVQDGGLGVMVGAEAGFQIGHHPDTVRAPDVAYVASERMAYT